LTAGAGDQNLALAAERRRRLRAIACMCGAVALFAGLDTSAKFLLRSLDPLEVVWARYSSAFVLAFLISNPLTRPGLVISRRPLLQVGRSALLLTSTVLNVVALRYLRLDQTLSILFSTPLFVTLLSGVLLGDWAGWRRWTAISIGFIGVLLIARPTSAAALHPAALLCVGGAICYAFYNISTRVLSRTDSNETTLFYSNLVGTLAMLPALPFIFKVPTLLDAALMLMTGVFGSAGHYLLIRAHRLAPASTLAPFIYTQLLWVTLSGYLVFGDLPDRWTLSGAAIVIASGLYIFYREHKLRG
jgi:drug/metabolite transporter (DMT)-like permease